MSRSLLPENHGDQLPLINQRWDTDLQRIRENIKRRYMGACGRQTIDHVTVGNRQRVMDSPWQTFLSGLSKASVVWMVPLHLGPYQGVLGIPPVQLQVMAAHLFSCFVLGFFFSIILPTFPYFLFLGRCRFSSCIFSTVLTRWWIHPHGPVAGSLVQTQQAQLSLDWSDESFWEATVSWNATLTKSQREMPDPSGCDYSFEFARPNCEAHSPRLCLFLSISIAANSTWGRYHR